MMMIYKLGNEHRILGFHRKIKQTNLGFIETSKTSLHYRYAGGSKKIELKKYGANDSEVPKHQASISIIILVRVHLTL